MAGQLTEETFSRQLGTKFSVALEGGREVELVLDEVKGFKPLSHERGKVERFSVYFYGPGGVLLQQQIYKVAHAEMGEMEIFIVPVARDERGFRYEAAFNYFA
ncbi:MAG TPA: hypothetical protein VD968_12095 [Pyrinomonadaceae bacterium]|nr:hypothetical protein [Pyrinomonadaceae bacterium]